MAAETTKTAYGYVFTCTSGTAVTASVVAKGTSLKVSGIHFVGAATSDIVTVYDGDGKLFIKGYGGTGLSNHNMSFAHPVRVEGLQIAFAGATTGACVVFCE